METDEAAAQKCVYTVYAKTAVVGLAIAVAMLTVVPWYVGGLLYLGYAFVPVLPRGPRSATYRTEMDPKSVRADIEPPAPVFAWLVRGRAARSERDGDTIRYGRDGRIGGFETILTITGTGENTYDMTFEDDGETRYTRMTLRSVEDETELELEQPDRTGRATLNDATTEQLVAWFEKRFLAARGYRKVEDSGWL
jgi:hypothetical protein